MTDYPRRQFGTFSLEVPPGLFEDEDAPPGLAAALTAIAPATLRIRIVPAEGATNLATLMAALSPAASQEVFAKGRNWVWPGLAASETGDPRSTHFLFESAGTVFHGLAEAPADLWADYGPFLERAMQSIDIGEPPSPTLSLFPGGEAPAATDRLPERDPAAEAKSRLAAASEDAVRLILFGQFSDAEALLQGIDRQIYGACALADAYEAALTRAPDDIDIFERARLWAWRSFPDPHTEVEAETFRAALEEIETRLQEIHARK